MYSGEKMKKTIVCKWYKLLGFPQNFDEAFYSALNSVDCAIFTNIDDYDTSLYSPQENLLSYLYFCEQLQKRYQEKEIPSSILLDTLHDIVIWTNVHYQVHNEFGLSELSWLKRHLSFKLFKLGRLQYCISGSEFDVLDIGLKKDDGIIEVHIPEGEPLLLDACKASLKNAQAFFRTYFPAYEYEYYTCHSWLLDKSLLSIMDKNSNIALFQTLFQLRQNDVSDALLKYIFRWDATRKNLHDFPANSSLAKKVKRAIEDGQIFHETLGVIPKNSIND